MEENRRMLGREEEEGEERRKEEEVKGERRRRGIDGFIGYGMISYWLVIADSLFICGY